MVPGRGTVDFLASKQLPCREPAATTARSPTEPQKREHGARPADDKPSLAGRGTIAMANILVNIEKGIEIGAEDILKWLTGANKALHAAPEVVAALATLIGAVEKPLADISSAATNPLNIALDIQTVNDLKATWPAVKE